MLDYFLKFSQNGGSLNLQMILMNTILAFVLCLLIALVYRQTHKGLSYSQSFTAALVLVGMLIAVIIMVIGDSIARAFGAFGVFSIIRFRTAIKDSKDIAFILLVMAVGLAAGTGAYAIAVFTAIFSIIVIYIFAKTNFGAIRKYDYVLTFSARTDKFSVEKMRAVFLEFLASDNLLNVFSRDNGEVLDYNFNIKFVKASDIEKFIGSLSQIEGAEGVEVISAKNDIEY